MSLDFEWGWLKFWLEKRSPRRKSLNTTDLICCYYSILLFCLCFITLSPFSNPPPPSQKANYYGSLFQSSTVCLGAGPDGKEVNIPFRDLLPMVHPNDIVFDGKGVCVCMCACLSMGVCVSICNQRRNADTRSVLHGPLWRRRR